MIIKGSVDIPQNLIPVNTPLTAGINAKTIPSWLNGRKYRHLYSILESRLLSRGIEVSQVPSPINEAIKLN